MKKIRKVAATLFLLLSLLMAFSCVAQAKTYTKKINSYKGAIFTIKKKGLNNKRAKWSVDSNNITVNKNGKVTVIKTGKATITAKYKKNTYKFVVNAKQERTVNKKAKYKGTTIKILSMSPDAVKIQYTNTNKKMKKFVEAYFIIGKKTYIIEKWNIRAIPAKTSKIFTLKRGKDFSGKLDMNANIKTIDFGYWYLE